MFSKSFILFLCSCFITNILLAQATGEIQGKIVDSNNDIIGFASVLLQKNGAQAQGASADVNGNFAFKNISPDSYDLVVNYIGYATYSKKGIVVKAGEVVQLTVMLNEEVQLQEIVMIERPKELSKSKDIKYRNESQNRSGISKSAIGNGSYQQYSPITQSRIPVEPESNTEEYSALGENGYKKVKDDAFSTFSIDVDRASYSNIRRFINQSQQPPQDAVRVEEMINYFDYHYPQPTTEHPFSVSTEVSDCPWNEEAKLIKIGLQGKKIDLENAPASNLVFLIDVSGSMGSANKLPLLKESIKLLINNMREQDKMALVVYASASGLVQESTNDKAKLIAALDALNSGGSTAGGAGINLAYKVAKDNYIDNGNNRIILATDGDFNVGTSSNEDLEKLIVEKRNDNIFLTCLGFGMGNYKDSKMEILADKGNGNYAYIDNINEAKKTLVNEMGGTLYVIAKDVKLQLEFDSTQVHSYRLVGYENRMLNKEDFEDDKKDAGEMGAGHTVTALYEIVLVGTANTSKEENLLTLKLRYKEPKGDKSVLMEQVVKREFTDIKASSENFRFAASVAGFGMLLRDSKYKNDLTYAKVLDLAKGALGEDKQGYRAEFFEMVKNVNSMSLHAKK